MPIIIKETEWKQTQNTVTIKVPLRGVHPSKVDIFYHKFYLKASFEQYFYEAFLLHPIDTKKSNCTLTNGHIIFELIKCESMFWEKLELDVNKTEKQDLKKRYIEEAHKQLQEECEEKRSKNSELKRLSVSEQIAIDAKQRETIENIKKEEKDKALKDMELWNKKITPKTSTRNKTKITSKSGENKPKICEIPPPRATATLNVSFTSREFPTPSRESRLEEENEWLRKQAEARRSVGFISEDIRPEEHNPQFLKEKGDEFLRNRNFLGAVSAYSFGIKLNNKFPDLYVGRAAAHLVLGNYNKTCQDCSRALELMKPEVPLNLKERALCIGRRGIALVKLGLVKEGVDELKASLRLVPDEYFSSQLEEATENLNNETNS